MIKHAQYKEKHWTKNTCKNYRINKNIIQSCQCKQKIKDYKEVSYGSKLVECYNINV